MSHEARKFIPYHAAIVLEAHELDGMNALYFLGLAMAQSDEANVEVGLQEVKRIPDDVMHQLAKKLWHANRVIKRMKDDE